jgi:formylglycine-generating enzyme
MRRVRGGSFRMGSENFYPEERPVRTVSVGDFWIDETPVTNAQFARFVRETGHVTLAERAPDPGDYPGMDPALVVPGSAVFSPPAEPVVPGADPGWWQIVPGADWRHPLGPEDSIEARPRHPAVHIGHADAEAYAAWAGKALPTEAEWEYAARGGLDGADYAWGDALHPDGRRMAKTWEGIFPWLNTASPALRYTSPVGRYPANGFGLHDMIGNVWEWTADDYADPERAEGGPKCCGARGAPPQVGRKVLKGGSHLCSPDYCRRYRPAARWPQPIDTTTSHVGFRCIVRN